MPSQVPPIKFFHEELDKHFRFLAEEYGFVRAQDHLIEPRAIFQNADLDLWIGYDNGTYDAIFWLKKNVPWLLPHESKKFRIDDIVRLLAGGEFQRIQEHRTAGWMTAEQECQALFQYFARALNRHCESILRGEYQIFQQVYARRKTVVQ